jgi:hypothetical protein
MAANVSVWNASQFPLQLVVNRGRATTISAVNTMTWAAGTAAAGGPGWGAGGPGPGNFGPGDNIVQVSFGPGEAANIRMNLPNQNPSSVQVYFFAGQGGDGGVQWVVLYSGSLVAQGSAGSTL